MQRIKSFVRELDTFSVPFSPAINDNEEFYHKSLLGGLISLLLLGMSGYYAINILLQWQYYELIPKVTQKYEVLSKEEVLQSQEIRIRMRNVGYNLDGSPTVDPFDPQSIIILPYVSMDIGDYYAATNYEQFYFSSFLSMRLPIKNESQPIVTFILCQEKYLYSGQKCAGKDKIDKFFQQIGNQLFVEVFYTIINPSTFNFDEIKRTYSLIINPGFCTIETLYLQLTRYEIDRAYIFEPPGNQYQFTDSNHQEQLTDEAYCSKLFLPSTLGVLWLIQQPLIKVETLQYPQIGEILANIGSIVSLLFMAKYVMVEINSRLLREQCLNFLVKQYYPEIQLFKSKKNLFRCVREIKYKNMKINVKKFEEFQANIRKLIASKLNYLNLVYEISRIQIVLNSLQKREQLLQSHLVGIRLRFVESVVDDTFLVQDDCKQLKDTILNPSDLQEEMKRQGSADKLQISDAVIFALQTNQLLRENPENVPKCEMPEFYELNKLKF